MDDINIVLKAIINGQSSIKVELLTEIKKVGKKVDKLTSKMNTGFEKINERIDQLEKEANQVKIKVTIP